MKKLQLNLESLDVETFYLDPAESGLGTVQGEQQDSPIDTDIYPRTNYVTCTSGPCIQSKNSPDCWTRVTSACKQGGTCWDVCADQPDEPPQPDEPGIPGITAP